MIRVRWASHGLELELGSGEDTGHAGRREKDTVSEEATIGGRARSGGHNGVTTMDGGHDEQDTMGRPRWGEAMMR